MWGDWNDYHNKIKGFLKNSPLLNREVGGSYNLKRNILM
jgi:hypothetical protein